MPEQHKYIEAGWEGYKKMVLPQDAPEIQIRECRQAFYAGAAVLFESLVTSLDPDPEPTEEDIQRMESVGAELREFGQEIDQRYLGGNKH